MAVSQIQAIAGNVSGNNGGGLLARLRLLASRPEQRGKMILVVEGPDDLYFYDRFLNPSRITLYPGLGCRNIVLELRSLTDAQLTKIRSFLIVILDADGIRLPGVTPKQLPDMVFRTDTRDWETTVMRDLPLSDFWTATLGQPGNEFDRDRDLFDPLYVWSCTAAHCFIRQYMHGLNASANMSHFDWRSHTNLSLPDTLAAIKGMRDNMENGAVRPDVEEALDESAISDLLRDYVGVWPWDLHRGHNLVKGLCHHYQRVSRRQLTEKKMTHLLADSFPPAKFRATALGQSLEAYLLSRGIADAWRP